MFMARTQGEELERFTSRRDFPPQVPAGHGAAAPGAQFPCPAPPMGPWGAAGARRAPRLGPPLPAAPVPRGASELRRQRSPPALHRGARPPLGHRGRSGRDGSGREGTGRDGTVPPLRSARGCSAAARSPRSLRKPPPRLFLHMGRTERGGECAERPRLAEAGGPGPAPPHLSSPLRAAPLRPAAAPARPAGAPSRKFPPAFSTAFLPHRIAKRVGTPPCDVATRRKIPAMSWGKKKRKKRTIS